MPRRRWEEELAIVYEYQEKADDVSWAEFLADRSALSPPTPHPAKMPFTKQLNGLLDKAKDQYEKYQASHQAPPVPPRPNQQYPGQQQHYQQQQQQPQQYYPASTPNRPNAGAFYPGGSAPHYYPGSHPPPQQQQSYQQPPPQQYGQHQHGYGQPPYQQPPYQQPYQQPPPQQYGQTHGQPPYGQPPPFGQPPPIPTHPNAGPPAYWEAVFAPNTDVSVNFEHKHGAHGWGNNEAQNYGADPRNSFHTHTHALVLRAVADARAPDGQKHTSARLVSHQTLARDRGFLQVRLTAPSAKGIWPAFWLLPREPFTWPHDGEVDIFEAWNGQRTNHACLHWGFFTPEDANKHRVIETPIPALDHPNGRVYGFAWDQDGPSGRMVWYVDGMPVMKALIPSGTRRLSDFQIVINIAMGGNVNAGVLPDDGQYEMVIHSLKLHEEPIGGWQAFEGHWQTAPEGHAN